MIRPPAIEPGAGVALVAAAGPLPDGALERAAERVRTWGWVPRMGAHAHRRSGFLAGSDAERAADLNHALHDPAVDAVWFLRGGYGTMRILDAMDWSELAARPRALIGFSDNTAVHLAALRAGVVSFHGPHAGAAEFSEFSEDVLRRLLTQHRAAGVLPFPDGYPSPRALHGGAAEGPLVGGNLALLAALVGTPYAPRLRGAILFLEEVGEPGYRIDRMLTQLRLAGTLDGVAGVAVGALSERPDAAGDDLPDADAILLDRLGDLGVPILAGLPFGHIDPTWTLPVGVRAQLNAEAGTLALVEPCVAG